MQFWFSRRLTILLHSFPCHSSAHSPTRPSRPSVSTKKMLARASKLALARGLRNVANSNKRCLSSFGSYNTLLTEQRDNVAVITLNRPKALNALCDELIAELNTVTRIMDKDPSVKAIVITGSDRAFAAGADITEMCERDYMEAYQTNMFEVWGDLAKVQTPTIAAVRGFALGGGCELAMTCDIMIAGPLRSAGVFAALVSFALWSPPTFASAILLCSRWCVAVCWLCFGQVRKPSLVSRKSSLALSQAAVEPNA